MTKQRPTPKTTTLARAVCLAALATSGLMVAPTATGQAPAGAAAPTSAPTSPPPSAPKAASKPAARKAGSHSMALKQNAPVTVNFVNAEIEAVSRAMGAMLNKQFLVDPRVKGQITVYGDDPMTIREAYINYLAALRGLGYTVVESGSLLKVVPEADAKLQGGPVEVGRVRRGGDQILTQVFRLNHENPNNLVPVLRPLISPNNTINANPGNQTLVITDYADNLARLGKIIAALDNPASSDMEVIPLKHAVAVDVATIVQRMAAGGAAAGTPGAAAVVAGTSSVSVLAEPRSNALIVQTSSPAKLAQVRAMVAQLDVPTKGAAGPGGNIWVVYLKNADATRLAQILRASFAAPQQSGTGGFTPTAANAPAQQQQPTMAGAGASGQSLASQPLQRTEGVQTGGFIQADPSTNSLIITAPEALYRQIRNVIEQLDARRAQVFVESMIVKVNAEKMAEMGVQWQGLLGDSNKYVLGTNYGSGGNNILRQSGAIATGSANGGGLAGAAAAVAQVGAPGAGLNFGLIRAFAGVQTLASMARFLETNTGANVLSTPTLVALDNEEAQIVIGQNVPFVTGTFASAGVTGGAAVNPFQTIERKDVGLTLRVKSQIGEGGTIRMTVYQENSSVASTAGTNGPTTDKSAISTSVVVEDGQIMVLGGLLKDEYTDGDSRVPGLGDVPIAGNLFKAQERKRIKSNLMVFLRPVVMRTSSDTDSVTVDRYEAIRSQQRAVQPTSGVGQTPDGPLLPPIQNPTIAPPGTVPTRPAPASPTPLSDLPANPGGN